MLAGPVCHASLFCTSCLFLAFFPAACMVFPGCGMLGKDAELLCALRGVNLGKEALPKRRVKL